jgi:hypothetical protein
MGEAPSVKALTDTISDGPRSWDQESVDCVRAGVQCEVEVR